ncbi:phosphonate C-P lyase system protein PhnH [Bacillus salitolerans]|uniref:Phosphonate C-P lyase system protein PhnH n=1 Tax=Bacillus salitolerans TaxID=1437434 RepID=A0ABW4LL97_9BACI
MTKANYDTFDFVHGTQQIFRKLVDCMARPGKVNSLKEDIWPIEGDRGLSKALIGLAYTLLDREVSFYIVCEEKERVEQFLKWSTFSTTGTLQTADYIFIQHSLSGGEFLNLVNQVKCGTLTDPHNSATLIFHVEEISVEGPIGLNLIMSGPGIKETTSCYVKGLPTNLVEVRKEVNKEFPIGVDIIVVSSSGEMVGIPRTTMIESEGYVWDM